MMLSALKEKFTPVEMMVHVINDANNQYISKLELVEEIWDLKLKGTDIYSIRDRGLTISALHDYGGVVKAVVRQSIDGSAPIALTEDLLCIKSRDGFTVDVWKDENRKFSKVANLKAGERIITCLNVSKDGFILYGAGWDNTLFIWDLNEFILKESILLPGCASSIAVSDDGAVFVGGSSGFLVKLQV